MSYLALLLYILEYLLERVLRLVKGEPLIDEQLLHGKVAIVTGANSGLGKEVALALAQRGCKVVLACRNLRAGEEVVKEILAKTGCEAGSVLLRELDLSLLSSVRSFCQKVGKEVPEIHLLINNAGVYYDAEARQVTEEGFEVHMGVNHLGHFLLTNLLLENLKRAAPSRVVTVSSTNQLIAQLDLNDLMLEGVRDFGFQNTLPYNNSKLANSLFTLELGKRLMNSGVTTYSCCPGLVQTEVFRNFTPFRKFYTKVNIALVGLSAKQGAETILYCALSKDLKKETGRVYRFCRHFQSANRKLDASVAKRLWDMSEQLVGLKQ